MGGPALAIAGFLCVLALPAYVLLRHVYLTALTVAAPLCVLAAGFALPHAWKSGNIAIGLVLAPICTLLLSDRISRSVCMGVPARVAVIAAIREFAAAAGPIFAAYVLELLAFVSWPVEWQARIANALMIAVAFALPLVLGVAAMWFDYPEDFIARANLARERRERSFERPAGLAETRWSLSVTGIAVVIGAVALLAIRGLHAEIDWHAGARFGCSVALLAGAFAAITRNWRLTLAAVPAVALVALLVLWMYARIDPQSLARFDLWLNLMPVLVAMSVLVLQLSRHINRDETPASAVALSLREQGPATTAAFAVIAAVAVIELVLFKQLWLVDCMPVLAGAAAALLFFPAFGNVIYWLLPRYRSADEVFGKR
jgi:hypothetical protein